MYFKSWNYTTCIRSDNLAAIEQAMTNILEQEEGCRRLPRPFQRTSNIERISINPEGTVRDLWIVGLFSGSDGWTIIKTAKVVGGSSNYWYLNNLAYRIYNDPKEFEIDGVRLLYFQPPITYNPIPDNMAHANQPDTAWERYRANDEDEEEF